MKRQDAGGRKNDTSSEMLNLVPGGDEILTFVDV